MCSLKSSLQSKTTGNNNMKLLKNKGSSKKGAHSDMAGPAEPCDGVSDACNAPFHLRVCDHT